MSSLDKMRVFEEKYLAKKRNEPLIIADIGAQNIGGSYREIFSSANWKYLGIDISAGENIDLVVADPYDWVEIKTDSIDVIISGQTFEHIEFFWLTIGEFARVLKPGGLCCIIAPSGGREHRYPVDCWRFYPDGFKAMAKYGGLNVLEAWTQWETLDYTDDSDTWADTILIAAKPDEHERKNIHQAIDDNEKNSVKQEHFYERIDDIDTSSDDSLAILARWMKPGSTVLELGPATGYFTKYLQQNLGCTVDCVELSASMAERAAAYCRQMWVADLDEITLEDRFKRETYDYIVVADVLEHLKNPEKILSSLWLLLKQSGSLLLSLPNISHAAVIGDLLQGRFCYRDEGLLDRTHLRFFTGADARILLRQCGYKIARMDKVSVLPEDTEFGDDFADLPADIQNTLLKRPDALTYQFIIEATPGGVQVADSYKTEGDSDQLLGRMRENRRQREERRLNDLSQALACAEHLVSERDLQINEHVVEIQQLGAGLAHAEQLIPEYSSEIQQLRAGLAHAEEIVSRQNLELSQIKDSFFWRVAKFFITEQKR
ncbi:MAG: methyltransferase domain-containing protein [Pseudomonadota bacterium]|nr:methyltransferase domain-containing protein [Pseudomonadota bacterium]